VTTPPIRLPSGVRDFLPRAAARRRALAGRVLDVFEAWGYARVVTPVFEVADVLERGLGHDGRSQAIRFVEPGTGEIVALRPDITPQIARVVATRLSEIEGPLRLCYEGAVTRLAGERGQREILQAGVELVDAGVPGGDAEVLAVAAAALAAADLPETRLDIGHVAPARFVLGAAPDDESRDRIAQAIAKKDRVGLRIAAKVLPPDIAPLAEALANAWGPAEKTLDRIASLAWPSHVASALAELRAVIAAFGELADQPVPALTVDLGDLRGFDYYTGVRFAGYASGAPEAVLRGGRYDELIGRYGRPARATGFALDLEALAQAQRALGLSPPSAGVGVAVHGTGAAALARALRSHGVRAVTVASPPTTAWLKGAGLDAGVLVDAREMVRATNDGDVRTQVDLDPRALATLLEENRCPS
jgi:ATP phosphoribosyltransferase regulatory subunit